MLKILRILTICSMIAIGSGCAANDLVEPICLPDRPELPTVSNEEKIELWSVNSETVQKLAIREARLKNHIETIEELADAHNQQFKAACAEAVSPP